MRNALEIVSEIAARDPYAVAMALGNYTILITVFHLNGDLHIPLQLIVGN